MSDADITYDPTTDIITIGDDTDIAARRYAYVNNYLRTWNKSEACALTGLLGSPHETHERIMSYPDAREYFIRAMEELALNKDIVLARLGDIARNAGMWYLKPDLELDVEAMIRDGKQFLIKKITWGKYGPIVELHDPLRALELLAKYYAGISEGEDTGQVQITVRYESQTPTAPVDPNA